nr:hypothetical protein KPHV_06470 [Kitasatospora purpeofusca]
MPGPRSEPLSSRPPPTCPLPVGRRYLDRPVPDPDGAPIERVRGSHVQALLAELVPTRPK